MRISAVIPTLSPPSSLPSLVRTLRTFCDEVIVVVDGAEKSTDLPGAYVIHNGRWLGFSRSANAGLRRSSGEVILLVNDDVEVKEPGKVERALELFASLPPEVGTCNPTIFNARRNVNEGLSRLLYFRGKFWVQNPSARPDTVVRAKKLKEDERFLVSFNACGSFLMLKRSFLDKVGYFDENYSPFYWEDVDLSLRAHLNGYVHCHYPEAKVIHLGSATTSRAKKVLWTVFRRNHLYLMLKFTGSSKTLGWRTRLWTTLTLLKAGEMREVLSLFKKNPLGIEPFSPQMEVENVKFLSSLFTQEREGKS